jgi:hypothetical protein
MASKVPVLISSFLEDWRRQQHVVGGHQRPQGPSRGGGLQRIDIANIVAVSPSTVSRWSSGKATPDLKTQTVIAEPRYVVDRLAEFYARRVSGCTPPTRCSAASARST